MNSACPLGAVKIEFRSSYRVAASTRGQPHRGGQGDKGERWRHRPLGRVGQDAKVCVSKPMKAKAGKRLCKEKQKRRSLEAELLDCFAKAGKQMGELSEEEIVALSQTLS